MALAINYNSGQHIGSVADLKNTKSTLSRLSDGVFF